MTFERYHPGKLCFFCAFLQNNSIKGGITMSRKFENKTKRLVILRLNSGQTLFIDPGTFSREIEEKEVSNNTMVKKLLDRGVIAVHSYPGEKPGPLKRPLKQSPAPASAAGIEEPDQKKKDKKQIKSKGGK
jgi:hypothetical protein